METPSCSERAVVSATSDQVASPNNLEIPCRILSICMNCCHAASGFSQLISERDQILHPREVMSVSDAATGAGALLVYPASPSLFVAMA